MTPQTWARAAPLIHATLIKDKHLQTLGDVRHRIVSGEAQLWFTGKAVCVTLDDGDHLRMWLWGGDIAELPGLGNSIIGWARVMGYFGVIVSPFRPAWRRLLKQFGAKNMENGDIYLSLETDNVR